jgi:chromosomal replication initiation ATPase DnaA
VKVCIRIRPLNDREKASAVGKSLCLNQVDQTTLVVDRVTDHKNFVFDFVGGAAVDQAAIFNAIAKPIADSCMQGYNGSIFAYGQTGAGKTFTIQGPEITDMPESGIGSGLKRPKKCKTEDGVIQRSFEYIF